jgi:hypothetical protein
MSRAAAPRDLIMLVADRDQEAAIRALLLRPQALGLRELTFDIRVHPRHDPGCLLEAHDFLRPFARQYRHALVVFDRSGCGQDERAATELEEAVVNRIPTVWTDRVAAIVVDPEIEAWVWSGSPHVATALGWSASRPILRQWLNDQGLWTDTTSKPSDPKAAMEAALREIRRPRSSSIFREMASRVSVEGCVDPSFGRFRTVLTRWFGVGPVGPASE